MPRIFLFRLLRGMRRAVGEQDAPAFRPHDQVQHQVPDPEAGMAGTEAVEGVVQLNMDTCIGAQQFREYLGISSEEDMPIPKFQASTPTEMGGSSVRTPPTREELEQALLINRFNRTNTAQYLGISRKTLYRWMERYHL